MTLVDDRPSGTGAPTHDAEVPGDPRGERGPERDALIDAGAVALLSVLGLWGFHASFGGVSFLIVGLLGLLLGLGIAYLGWRLGQPLVVVATVALVVVVLLSGAVALRTTALDGVLPTRDTVAGLGQGFTHGWKELVTTPPPVGSLGYLLAIPYLCGFLSGLLGLTGALRSRRLWWGLIPPVLVLGASILTSVAVPTSLLLQGACFVGVTLAWASARAGRAQLVPVSSTTRRGGRLAMATVLVLASAFIGLVIGPHAWGADTNPRLLLRSYVEPDVDLHQYPSPLTSARLYLRTLEKTPLFTVHGLPAGAPVRLAVMDYWDGTAFAVAGTHDSDSSGAFRRVGDSVPTTDTGTAAHVDITIDAGYKDVWAPVVGAVTAVSVGGPDSAQLRQDLRYNLATNTGLVVSGLHEGDVLNYDIVVPAVPPDAETLPAAQTNQPTNAPAPEELPQVAGDWVGDAAGPLTRVTRIGQELTKGFYALAQGDSAQPPGHGYTRLKNFLSTKFPLGDEEQYGATAALMARSAGVPARLVMGFRPGVQEGKPTSGDVTVNGRDLSVWVEVDLEGVGWVPVYDITPPRTRQAAKKQEPRPQPKVETQVPPPPPTQINNQPNVADAKAKDTGDQADSSGPLLPVWLVVSLMGVAIPALLAGGFVALVVGLKRRRAKRRRFDPDPARAVTSGWAEFLDRARDHGHRFSRMNTRTEGAELLADVTPVAIATLPKLASHADAAAFGPDTPTSEQVAAYWADVDSAHAALEEHAGFWGRWRARLALGTLIGIGSRRRRKEPQA